MPLIPLLRRQTRGIADFQVSLVYRASSDSWSTYTENPFQKNQPNKQTLPLNIPTKPTAPCIEVHISISDVIY